MNFYIRFVESTLIIRFVEVASSILLETTILKTLDQHHGKADAQGPRYEEPEQDLHDN